jgi:hypothetical protein
MMITGFLLTMLLFGCSDRFDIMETRCRNRVAETAQTNSFLGCAAGCARMLNAVRVSGGCRLLDAATVMPVYRACVDNCLVFVKKYNTQSEEHHARDE